MTTANRSEIDPLSRYDVATCSDEVADRFFAYRQGIADLHLIATAGRPELALRFREWRRAVR